jgi:CRISPR/Cas system-associated exonuclease Cas4 (RecB family)
MTEETMEKIITVENMTKEKMAKAIKTAKREAESSEKKKTVSTGVTKNNTSEIIQKIKSQIPTYVQLYSDLYTKYLEVIDDIYAAWYVSGMAFFDKLVMDKSILGAFEIYRKSFTEMTLKQIEMATNFAKMYVQFRLATLDSYDKVTPLMIDSYTRAWNQSNPIQ